MGKPAIVEGDLIMGQCVGHLIPGPLGAPVPGPPFPFTAPITKGTVKTVKIMGKAAAVVGNSGINITPHAGLHPSDPKLVPVTQEGRIIGFSKTVLIGGKPAAADVPPPLLCVVPGRVIATGLTVLIG